jgi:hypothetical protein
MAEAVWERVEVVSIRSQSQWDEAFIQEAIWKDPRVLGLGPLVPRAKERVQPHKGRLDILLESEDATSWYEVEVQLGATDESHIIRTIEYWDVERKRYPDIQHTAVIVAEDITSRFFNVISLFNQTIPIIALKLSAVKIGDRIGLLFTRILDLAPQREGVDVDYQPVDRAYWESRSSDATMEAMDRILQIARESNSKIELKYNKGYVGTIVDGEVSNFLTLRPRKKVLNLGTYLTSTPEHDKLCEDAGFQIDYDPRYSKYRFALAPEEVAKHVAFFRDFISRSYKEGA